MSNLNVSNLQCTMQRNQLKLFTVSNTLVLTQLINKFGPSVSLGEWRLTHYYEFENICRLNTKQRLVRQHLMHMHCKVCFMESGFGEAVIRNVHEEIMQKKFICRHLGIKSTIHFILYKYILAVKTMSKNQNHLAKVILEYGCLQHKPRTGSKTCSNIQKFHIRIPFNLFIQAFTLCLLSNMKALHIFQLSTQFPNIVRTGTISPTRHLDHFEHTKKKHIVEAANNNGLKLAKYSISTCKLYDMLKDI